MSSQLHTQISRLAASFADAILDAIRDLPLEELLASRPAPRRAAARSLKAPAVAHRMTTTAKSSGRLPRRSAADIAKQVDRVVALVKKRKDGLRAEQIRVELGLLPKEMPRVLKEGLTAKKLTCKGQKRATTYFAK
jgi:hypothetical protein